MFLETLVDFIAVHKEDLQDWLFVLLTQLLKKMGADLLGSVQAKVQKALDVTRCVRWKNWRPVSLLYSDCVCARRCSVFSLMSSSESLSLMIYSSPSL